MKSLLLAFVALCFFAASAEARTVRYPEYGYPAILFELPDDWTAAPDGADLSVDRPGDTSKNMLMSWGTYSGSVDELANELLKGEQRRGESFTMAGVTGYMYYTNDTNASGVHVVTKVMAIKPDGTHYFICSLQHSNDADTGDVDAMMASIQMAVSP